MSNKLFFNSGYGFTKKNIFFCETLDDKVNQIKKLEIDFFIDDLKKVLLHPNFPSKTKKILFSKKKIIENNLEFDHNGSWKSIIDYIF